MKKFKKNLDKIGKANYTLQFREKKIKRTACFWGLPIEVLKLL
jgi:hypothetical protein